MGAKSRTKTHEKFKAALGRKHLKVGAIDCTIIEKIDSSKKSSLLHNDNRNDVLLTSQRLARYHSLEAQGYKTVSVSLRAPGYSSLLRLA